MTPTRLLTVMFAAWPLIGGCASNGEASLQQGAKDAGHAVGAATREVGQGAKKAMRTVGHATRDGVKAVGAAAKEGAKEFERAVQGE